MLNLVEEATAQRSHGTEEDQDFHLDFMSWDTQKAFDSVGHHVQYLSWRRLGIPPNIAEWLVSLDLNGLFIPRVPTATGFCGILACHTHVTPLIIHLFKA